MSFTAIVVHWPKISAPPAEATFPVNVELMISAQNALLTWRARSLPALVVENDAFDANSEWWMCSAPRLAKAYIADVALLVFPANMTLSMWTLLERLAPPKIWTGALFASALKAFSTVSPFNVIDPVAAPSILR